MSRFLGVKLDIVIFYYFIIFYFNLLSICGSNRVGGRFSCYQWHACLWQRKWKSLMSRSYWTCNCLNPNSCLLPKPSREWSFGSCPISNGDFAPSHPTIISAISSPSSLPPLLPTPPLTVSPTPPISSLAPPVVTFWYSKRHVFVFRNVFISHSCFCCAVINFLEFAPSTVAAAAVLCSAGRDIASANGQWPLIFHDRVNHVMLH